jgi:2-dehydropantoate 2-reductase
MCADRAAPVQRPITAAIGHDRRMKTLIIGAGALGGVIAARLTAAGARVSIATRTAETARALRASGLRVTGLGGPVHVELADIAELAAYSMPFDLVILATKAHDALELAPRIATLVGETLLPIQNGGVAELVARRTGHVLGGLSNLAASMERPGVYEQTNAGHLLIGELAGGVSARAVAVRDWLASAIDVKLTPNLRGAIWSKLALNCSVTTLGAIAGTTMRDYIQWPCSRALFDRTYDEAIAVALASGARPERMAVEPIPVDRTAWLAQVLDYYGNVKPSMLQDFERGRTTEVDFINGYVESVGAEHGVATPVNSAIVRTVHAITRGELAPSRTTLSRLC